MPVVRTTKLADCNEFLLLEGDFGSGGAGTIQEAYDNAPTAPQLTTQAANPLTLDLDVAGNDIFHIRNALDADVFLVSDTRITTDVPCTINSDPLLDQTTVRVDSTFAQTAAYIGGAFTHTGAITYSNGLFINSTFGELVNYIAGVGPGFAAYTMMQGLPLFSNGGNFDLLNVIGINMGPTHARITAGTSVTGNVIGFSFAAQTRASVAGAVSTKTLQTGFSFSPTFSTVAASTVNLGTMTGMSFAQPGQALFQPGAGTENMTAYRGINFPNMTFGGAAASYTVINSQLNVGTNKQFMNHSGTARSTHNGQLHFTADLTGPILGASADVTMAHASGDFLFFQFNSAGGANGFDDQLRISNPAADRISMTAATQPTEINFVFDKGSFGEGGAAGNNKYRFVAQAETVTVGGEYSQFLLTQAANDTIDAAISVYAGWTINAPTPTIGTGSLTTSVGLNVGGNPGSATVNRVGLRIISNPSGGSGINAALWVTAGLSRFDGRVDINNEIALGGGATATLGTIGGSGPTAAAQAVWVEIDVNGVATWIAGWR